MASARVSEQDVYVKYHTFNANEKKITPGKLQKLVTDILVGMGSFYLSFLPKRWSEPSQHEVNAARMWDRAFIEYEDGRDGLQNRLIKLSQSDMQRLQHSVRMFSYSQKLMQDVALGLNPIGKK